jgi:uncharacterized membrane protein YjjB (DUF3815 family)
MLSVTDLLIQTTLGFVVTIGFAVLFNVPREALLQSAIIGAGGHLLRFSLRTLGLSLEVATFCGAFAVGLAGYLMARRLHMPRLVFTVTGIISMVPGIPAYEAIIHFSNGDALQGLRSVVRATLITGAIAGGLSTARLITEIGSGS